MTESEGFPFTDEFEKHLDIVSEGPLKQAVIEMYRYYEAGTFDPEDEEMTISAEGLLRDIVTVDRQTGLKLMAWILANTVIYLDARGLRCED